MTRTPSKYQIWELNASGLQGRIKSVGKNVVKLNIRTSQAGRFGVDVLVVPRARLTVAYRFVRDK